MLDAVTVAIALVITLGIFLAARPLWRRRLGPDRGQAVDGRNNPEKNVVQGRGAGTR